MRRSEPSNLNGYARTQSESANPHLWKKLLTGFSPSLGYQGTASLRCFGENKTAMTLNAMESDNLRAVNGRKSIRVQSTGGGTYGEYMSKSLSVTTYPVTVSCWCLSDNDDGAAIVSLNQNDTAYMAITFPAVDTLRMDTRSGASQFNSQTGTTSPGKWNHIVAQWKGSTSREMYVNGRLVMTSTASVNAPSASILLIGTLRVTGTAFTHSGYIGTTLVYTRSLAYDEILTLYRDDLAPLRVKPSAAYRVEEAGGAFQPAWASRATQVSGVTG